MSKYKGDLTGFPDEVVEWMLDQQEAQVNKRDVSVFEECRVAGAALGGFDWDKVKFPFMTLSDSHHLCRLIIAKRCFDLFLYPKKTPEPTPDPAQTPDFDEHRFQAACAAMRGILSNPHCLPNLNENQVADASVAHADALIEALKKGKQDDTTTTP